jgi:hypothetical protein
VDGLGAVIVAGMLVYMAFFGVPCAWLAEQKGRHAYEGLAFGAIFGIVGILVIGLAPSKPGTTWECPRCFEAIRPQASMCPHCGLEVDPVE